MGTAEVESALVAHEKVAESAVVSFPHEVKGEGNLCLVTLNAGVEYTEELRGELRQQVRSVIGPIATPGRDSLGACASQDAFRKNHA